MGTVPAGWIFEDLCPQCRFQREYGMFQLSADQVIVSQLDTCRSVMSVRTETFTVPGIIVAAFGPDQRPDLLPLRFSERVRLPVRVM